MENKKDYTKCTWKDCEKCREMPCRKDILKMLSKKGKNNGNKGTED